MQLSWIKCTGGQWCPLVNVNLTDVTAGGVYIIWHTGNPARTVYVGKGDIAERLQAHRGDQAILKHAQNGSLLATWATVAVEHRSGVERYLADLLSPLEGPRHPAVPPIAVNLPWPS